MPTYQHEPYDPYRTGSKCYLMDTFFFHEKDSVTGKYEKRSLTKEAATELLRPYWDAAVARDASLLLSRPTPGFFGPFGRSGDGPPIVPVQSIPFDKIRVNNKSAWIAAKKPGSLDIVVSDFQDGQIMIKQSIGRKNTVEMSGTWSNSNHTHTACGLFPASSVMPGTVDVGGYKGCSFTIGQRIRYVRFDWGSTPAELGFNVNALSKAIVNGAYGLSVDSSLVTGVLSDANTGLVDILTAMAETPETVKGILNGCMTILRAYKDARKGNLRLMDKVARRRLELVRLNAKTKQDWQDVKDLEKHLQDVKNLQKSIKDLLTAAADVWLQYRLAIYPTVKTVEALLDVKFQKDKHFFRFRDSLEFEWFTPSFAGWTTSKQLRGMARAFIKRGVGSGDFNEFAYSQNIAVTAWELIPLSFVVDRYMSIGTFLSAWFTKPLSSSIREGSTYSWKVDDAASWNHPSGAAVSVEIKFYKRQVINPNSFVCIPFPRTRSRDQHLDHLALTWNILLKNFWKV